MACTDFNIRILVDNRVDDGLIQEHGFSVWIEASGQRILFDTGQGTALGHNAKQLGCDLGRTDMLVLSHGHYDHSGAVSHVVRTAPSSRMFCHSNAFLPRYSIRPGEAPRLLSMPFSDGKAFLDVSDSRITWVTGPLMIGPDLGVSGPIARLHPLEDTGGPFFLDPEGRHPDPIRDDMSLWIAGEHGLIIITGCCHAGLINTVEQIRTTSGIEKVFAIIGGFHLLNASSQRLETTCAAIRSWNPEIVIPCHCTGDKAQASLVESLGSRVIPGYAGLRFSASRLPDAVKADLRSAALPPGAAGRRS